ncbi:MAG: hypothetical protein R2862_04675 [Thermoanaerobaculia bacterium]
MILTARTASRRPRRSPWRLHRAHHHEVPQGLSGCRDLRRPCRNGSRSAISPYLDAGPFHTNTREALQLSRALSQWRRQPNVVLITDGKPSALTEPDGHVYKNPMGLDLRIVNRTLEEADLCRRQKIVITTFMIATDPWLQEFVDNLTKVNRGRAYFASPDNLGEFLLADYIRHRRRRIR